MEPFKQSITRITEVPVDHTINSLKREGDTEITSTSNKRPEVEQDQPLQFFDLPAELRNLVYQEIATNQTVRLEGKKLKDESGLLEVEGQLHDEYLAMLAVYGNMEILIFNFDFRSVVTFINRLPETDVKLLPSIEQPTARKININIWITDGPDGNNEYEKLLKRWLNRFAVLNKRGRKLDISYALTGSGSHGMKKLWLPILDLYMNDSNDQRSIEEAVKIQKALLPKE